MAIQCVRFLHLMYLICLTLPLIWGCTRRSEIETEYDCGKNAIAIAIALRNYDSRFGSPPPRITYGANGSRLYSWRVLLLPYLGEQDKYQKIHLEESWDSPANVRVLGATPSAFRCSRVKDGRTPYVWIYDSSAPLENIYKDAHEFLVIHHPVQSVEWAAPVDQDVKGLREICEHSVMPSSVEFRPYHMNVFGIVNGGRVFALPAHCGDDEFSRSYKNVDLTFLKAWQYILMPEKSSEKDAAIDYFGFPGSVGRW